MLPWSLLGVALPLSIGLATLMGGIAFQQWVAWSG